MKLLEIKGTIAKAGFIPYVFENGQLLFMFMKSSDPKYGGDKPMIAKGHIDPGETAKEAAIREAEEELGLKIVNVHMDTIEKVWEGVLSGMTTTYTMTIFAGKIKDKHNFSKPHYETESVHWMTLDQFRKVGRHSQLNMVEAAARLLLSGK